MPRVRRVPAGGRDTGLAEQAIGLASGYGLVPDPWQAAVVTDWLRVGRGGLYAAMTCGLAVPRQNGKNGIIEVRELHGMVALGEKFLHSAHEVKTARKAFKRLKYFFGEKANDPNARFPELNRLVREVRSTNGQEAIVLHASDCAHHEELGRCDCNELDCASVEFVARSKGSGRGFTVDVLVLDEAQALTEDELEAMLSTISSSPLGNPQIILAGTPPNVDKGQSGEVFTRVRSDGISGADKQLCWLDFGVADGPLDMLNLDDRDQLYAVNPAMGGRLQERVAKTERRRLSPAGYARERLGWWGNRLAGGAGAIDLEQWDRLKRTPPKKIRQSVIVIDVAPDRSYASVGTATYGRKGRTFVIAEQRPGVAWVMAYVKRLIRTRDVLEVALWPSGQAGVLIPDLVEAGVEHEVLTTPDMGRACAWFVTEVEQGKVEHPDDPGFNDAIRNAQTRRLNEAVMWDRRVAEIDITPVVACSTASYRWSLLKDYDVMDSIG